MYKIKSVLLVLVLLLSIVIAGMTTEVWAQSTVEDMSDSGPGDLNSDGRVDTTDYALLKRYILSIINENSLNNINADLNSDGNIDTTDYSLLKRVILGLIEIPPDNSEEGSIKIMPLGDSITDGLTVEGGYRIKLWSYFQDNGYNVDFVGSQSNGPAELGDKDHEGYSGWTISQIDAEIKGWMDAAKPDIVLLHIGTNDVAFNDDMVNAGNRLGALIDKICAKLPADGKLYVAKIIPLSFGSVDSYNRQVSEVVNNKSDEGKPVYLVDMYSALSTADLADGVHPNMTGYNKMADVWFEAIRDDLSR